MRAVTEFQYLRRLMTNTDDDWPAVAGNLRKARVTWGRLARILRREGADPKVSRNFYIAVKQQVLLFGAETWVLTKRMEAALDTFQGRVARSGMRPVSRRATLPWNASRAASILLVRTQVSAPKRRTCCVTAI